MIVVAIDIGGTFTDLVGFDDEAVATLCAAILKAPRPAILGVKEYVKTAPDMAVFGAVEFARNLHATVNSSHEMRKKH